MREVPDWDEYFLGIADAVAKRSKDPNTQVGAVLVDADGHIIGTGYNGFPRGMQETPERWEKPEKYSRVIHAEASALSHAVKSAKGATIYLPFWPCGDCAKLIAAAGIRRVVCRTDYYHFSITEIYLKECGIEIKTTNTKSWI